MPCRICSEALTPLGTLDGIRSGLSRRLYPARVCVLCLARHVRMTLGGRYAGALAVVRCPVCVTPVCKTCWHETLLRSQTTIEQLPARYTEYNRPSQRACSLATSCCQNVYYCYSDRHLARAHRKSKARRQVTRFGRRRLEYWDVLTLAIDRFGVDGTQELKGPTLDRVADGERRALHMLEFLRKTRAHRAGSCFKCKRVGHQSECQDLDLAIEGRNKIVMRCSKCHTLVMTESGCDQVACVCGLPISWNSEGEQQEERRALGRSVRPSPRQSSRVLLELRRQVRKQLVWQRSHSRRVQRRR